MSHFVDTHPTARKSHRCGLCYRTIERGEQYRRSAGMDGSTAWTWIECGHCERFVRLACRRAWSDDGYDESVLIDFEPESFPEARVRAQWRRRWRRLDGTLFPLPDLTITEDKYGFGWPTTIAPGGAS